MFCKGDRVEYIGSFAPDMPPYGSVGEVVQPGGIMLSVQFPRGTRDVRVTAVRMAPKLACIPLNAHRLLGWIRERGGVAIWNCHDLSRPGQTWSLPYRTETGEPAPKQHWSMGEVIRVIRDPAEVIVVEPQEYRRFHVAIRMGGQGLKIKLTDASSRKLRAVCAEAERKFLEAWYEFDYDTQEAVVLVPGTKTLLSDWCAAHPEAQPAPESIKTAV